MNPWLLLFSVPIIAGWWLSWWIPPAQRRENDMHAHNDRPTASVHVLPQAGYRTIFQVRRAGYQVLPSGETTHTNEARLKTPSRKRQFGHSSLPSGGPDDSGPSAA